MGFVCFGSYAKIIKSATSQTDMDTVYTLLGSIIKPLSLKNKNGEEFSFGEKEVSLYMNSKENVQNSISSMAPRIKDSIGSYLETHIISKLVVTRENLLDSVRSLINNDVSISPTQRNNFFTLAKVETLSQFLGAVFIYAVQANNSFNAPKKTKKDLSSISAVPRLSDTEAYLLAEVNMCCPKCGNSFMKSKGKNAIPEYKLTHIWLLSPTPAQDAVLKTLTPPTYGFDDFENKIALCLSCQNTYLAAFSASEYNDLLSLKTYASTLYQARLSLDRTELENDLTEIVNKLAAAPQENLGEVLNMQALKIEKKIPPSQSLLRIKVNGYVVSYFYFIKELFGQASRDGSFNYDLLAQEVKLGCKKLLTRGLSQNDVFDELAKWVQKSSRVKNHIACEVIVSYFVQSCEVFDEIS